MTVYLLEGSNVDSCQVFGVFSTKEKAEENEKKLESSSFVSHNKIKLHVTEEIVDDDFTVDFFYNE